MVSQEKYSRDARRDTVFLVLWRRLRRPLFLSGLVGADMLSPLIAFLAAYSLRFGGDPYALPLMGVLTQASTQFALLIVTVAHVFMLRQFGLYRLHKTWLPLDFILRITIISTISALLLSVAGRGQDGLLGSRAFLLYFWLLLNSLTFIWKLGARVIVLLMLCFGIGVKKVVLIGATETAQRMLRTLRQHPQLGYRVVGMMFRGNESTLFEQGPAPTSHGGSASQVLLRLLTLNPDLVIIATSARKNDDMLDLIGECTGRGIEVRLVPEFYEVYSSASDIDRVGEIPMIHLRALKVPLVSAVVKRIVDLSIAMTLLPVFGVMCLVFGARAKRRAIPLLVKIPRAGLKGARFDQYGFSAALWGEDRSAASTPSQVPPWSVLLPQVLNLLKGDISVIGPRAGDLERAAHYNSWEKRILAVRPGLIGFLEADGTLDKDFAAEQMSWGIAYLDRRSMAFDVSVILRAMVQLATRGTVKTRKAE